jgi:DNA polymerase IV
VDRSIIHLNVADFAVAVERTIDCRLRHRPVIVAHQGAARAAVYDMSEEAYQCGVCKGMPLRRAERLCRDARILPPHPDRYERAMGAWCKQAFQYSPFIESGEGDGHLFIDVTGTSRLFGPAVDIAWRLGKEAKASFGLVPIWSVATNKLVSKVATRLVKPLGEYIVGAGEEEAFLAPLPLDMVCGIERGDLLRLREFNLTRTSHVVALPQADLEVVFGVRARFIYEVVRGIDASPVLPAGRRHPAVTVDHQFGNDTNEAGALENTLYALVEQAGEKLRKQRLAAAGITIVLDYSDGVRRVRRSAVKPPTAYDRPLFDAAGQTLRRVWTRRVRVRRMGLTCDRLVFPPTQQALFAEDRKESETDIRLMSAIDKIRGRFGKDAVRTGRTLAA